MNRIVRPQSGRPLSSVQGKRRLIPLGGRKRRVAFAERGTLARLFVNLDQFICKHWPGILAAGNLPLPAFADLAEASNTLIIPGNAAEIGSFVATAMTVLDKARTAKA